MTRIPWSLLVLLLLLIVVPVSEVFLLIQVGQQIGAPATIGILMAEALLGAWLLRREGSRAWASLDTTFRSGRMPSGELADAALVLVGGVLLILPGFITDVIGFLFLLPMTRPAARHVLGWMVARRINRVGVVARRAADPAGFKEARRDGVVIDGEVVPESATPRRGRPDAGPPRRGASESGTPRGGGPDRGVGPIVPGEIEDHRSAPGPGGPPSTS